MELSICHGARSHRGYGKYFVQWYSLVGIIQCSHWRAAVAEKSHIAMARNTQKRITQRKIPPQRTF